MVNKYRKLLKSGPWSQLKDMDTGLKKKIPSPPCQKSHNSDKKIICLKSLKSFKDYDMPINKVIKKRRSRRNYNNEYLTIKELSYLLWASGGFKDDKSKFRTTPSAGARYPIETYIAVNRVKKLSKGLYRYLPRGHKLIYIKKDDKIIQRVSKACFSGEFKQQKFVPESAVIFIWTAIPYRSEWRYAILAPRMILLEAGHKCQNLYLAGESIGVGICAVGAYRQEDIDNILEVDSKKELVIYIATGGKL